MLAAASTGACGAVGLAAMQLGALMGHKASWDKTRHESVAKSLGNPWENGGLMGLYGIYPLVMTNSLLWKMAQLWLIYLSQPAEFPWLC